MQKQISILLIEDDQELAELLQEYLSTQGYHTQHAANGESGLAMATSGKHYDVILLDIMLPKLDGYEVLKQLRLTHLTPVLMLTAKGDDFDRIFGLELGADDYLPKPFNHRELAARIKALVRRMEYLPQLQKSQPLRQGELQLDPGTQSAHFHQQPLTLTGTEFSMLQILLSQPGQLISKEVLSEQALGRRLMAFDRSIDMHISNIRKKLATVATEEVVKTVRGAGYILVLK